MCHMREGTPGRHEPPPCRYEPPIFARQTEPPLGSKSLRYEVNKPPLYRLDFTEKIQNPFMKFKPSKNNKISRLKIRGIFRIFFSFQGGGSSPIGAQKTMNTQISLIKGGGGWAPQPPQYSSALIGLLTEFFIDMTFPSPWPQPYLLSPENSKTLNIKNYVDCFQFF